MTASATMHMHGVSEETARKLADAFGVPVTEWPDRGVINRWVKVTVGTCEIIAFIEPALPIGSNTEVTP